MKSYVIIYRTKTQFKKTSVEKTIKSFPYWARITEDYWFVKTDKSANDIYNMINPIVGLNGRIIVVGVKRNAAMNYISTDDFLAKNL